MFKFLRKYNKYILAVGGTLLLITFLIPFAFTGLLQNMGAGRAAWASVGADKPHKVTVTELARVQRELRVLQLLGPQLQLSERFDRPEYWYLLVREASDAGLVPSPASIGRTDQETQLVGQLVVLTGDNPAFIRSTLANIQGVQRLLGLYADTSKYSDRRLRESARRLFHRVTVQPVVIEALAPADPPAYSGEELQQQMRKYADVAPGEGEMGFGYRLPDRAKLEWLTIPASSVRDMIAASDRVNPIELRKHWRRNASRFPDLAPGADIPDAVREDLIDELTTAALDEIARDASDRLRFTQRGLQRLGGYFELPDGWSPLPLQDLALELQAEHGIALPEYHATGERWLTEDDIAALPGIGTAVTDKFGQTPVALPQLVIAAHELQGSPTILVQRGIAGPPLRGADGGIYVFRIIDADRSRPPTSIDEVRDAVAGDLARLEQYRRLEAQAPEIRQMAADEGLLAVALAYDTQVRPAVSVSLGFPTQLPVIGQDEKTVETIVDYAMALPRDVPIADLPEEQRILVIPIEDRLSLLVLRLNDQTPLTEETFRSYMQFGIVQNRLAADELADIDLAKGPFSYEALAARHNFELAAGRGASSEPESTEPTEQDVSAAGG